MKLTDAVVKAAALPLNQSELTIWDSEVTGFGLRLRAGGRTYILAYRPAGAGRSATTRRLRLGTPETIKTATEARTLARAALGRVASGGDPHAERQEHKRREKARIADLLDRYKASLVKRRYVNAVTVFNGLKVRLKPHLNKDIQELSGTDYATIIEGLEKAGAHGAANDFRSRCSAFLSWCVSKPKVLSANPLMSYRKERATRAERLKQDRPGRALSDAELAKVWHAAGAATAFGRCIRYLILSGCRRGEGAGLTRAMHDRAGAVLRLPPAFVKQGRGHSVPISPAMDALFALCPIDARSDLMFPSAKTGQEINGWSKLIPKLAKASGADFTLHDLRRTFRTGLSRLGVSDEIAELALGHARAELEAIYNRDEAVSELQKAFNLWSSHVEGVCKALK
ncbi:tyrosine-type recombinase/integrase [Labrys sp. KB_33_2]|uniref:tyrosine-type recombinase/integrase n=1 Tax=Labrys sp. KB_33_2 TaxID=3237479 RepID=UPI003F920983